MTRRLRLLALLTLAALACGCAGVVEFKLPDEFKGRKLKEDPPLSLAPVPTEART